MNFNDERLFLRGFIASPDEPTNKTAVWNAISQRWRKQEFAGLTFRFCPLTPVETHSTRNTSVMVIGDAYDLSKAPLLTRLFGAPSLSKRLAKLKRHEFHEALTGMSGRFCIVVKDQDGLRVYHDPFGSRTVYYCQDGTFGSHIELVAGKNSLPRNRAVQQIYKTPEFLSRSVKYTPGDATRYERLYALPPNHYLDVEKASPRRYWPTNPKRRTTFDDVVPVLDEHGRSLSAYLSARNPVIGITGGVDARVVVSTLLRNRVSFEGCTWVGRWIQPQEVPIVEKIVALSNISHFPIETRHDPSDETANLAGFNSGRTSSAITSAMSKQWGGNPGAVFVRGYGGEIIRGFYNLSKNRMTNDSPEEMMRLYGSGIKIEPSDEYKRLCLPFFERWAEITDLAKVSDLGYDRNDIFYWENRMGIWGAAMLNEMDPGIYSVVGLNSRKLYDVCYGLDDSERLTKKFFIRLVATQYPALAEIPYA